MRTVVVRELTAVTARLRRALHRPAADGGADARPAAQIEVLQRLRDGGAVRLGELAGTLRLAPSTVSALVATLVSDGLASRDVDATDRRAFTVELTDNGRLFLREWDSAHQRRVHRALRRLPDEDRTAVASALPALAKLVDLLDAEVDR